MKNKQIDGLSIVAVAVFLFMAISSWLDKGQETAVAVAQEETAVSHTGGAPPPTPARPLAADSFSVIAPYDDYIMTQGLHGFSYGHMAIDLAAGNGATIKSPIHGYVSERYVDEFGNTVLVLENEIYQITLMHGEYTVSVGEQVKQGQPVGTESNIGYTLDMYGNSCRGRDCGYHTHLNIYNKQLRSNVNPLEVIRE